MEYKTTDWNGFECLEFEFEGCPAIIVNPKCRIKRDTLILKTEYFNAFPETEIALLERGYRLGFVKNKNRWGTDEDIDRKASFVRFCAKEFGMAEKCVPVGMSCGGIFAVKLAAKYPALVSCVFVDAPVINYMSCPCGFGSGNALNDNYEEILNALSLNGINELLAYRDMPLDYLDRLAKLNIPVILVAGDSDCVVPFEENGLFLQRAYEKASAEIKVYLTPGRDHHPHGLPDPEPIVSFIEQHT